MGVKFILGEESVDRQGKMLNYLKNLSQKYPNNKFFYLVPEHIKFESEVEVLKFLQNDSKNLYASTNVQILSFTRLAWFFLRDTSSVNKQSLSQMGLTMLITHLLNHIKHSDLMLFSDDKNQIGFANKLAQQIIELRMGNFNLNDLDFLTQYAKNNKYIDLADKLSDLRLVYNEFINYKINNHLITDQYMDITTLMNFLIDYLKQNDLNNYYFFVSGFSTFNAKELEIITWLIDHSKETIIDLPMNRSSYAKIPGKDHIFYQSSKLYHQLVNSISLNVNIQIIWPEKLRVSKGLNKLDHYWVRTNQNGLSIEKQQENINLDVAEDIQIIETVNRISEIKWVAGEIRRIVAKNHNFYNDFMILTPSLEKYKNIINPIFKQYEIPVFIDIDKSMSCHPLVEFILALFEIQEKGYNYYSLMKFLKTELFVPEQIITGNVLKKWMEDNSINDVDCDELQVRHVGTYRDTLDRVENYILEKGIQNKNQWEKQWNIEQSSEDNHDNSNNLKIQESLINRNINLLRTQVLNCLNNYLNKLDSVKTCRDFAIVLFDFLQSIKVKTTLQTWQNEHNMNQPSDNDHKQQQVWNMFCKLLDEYVLALGDETFDRQAFINIFQNGFDVATYKQVPSTLDQVIFSSTESQQMKNRKILFIVGATDDVLPQKIEDESLLSEEDRNNIEKALLNKNIRNKFLYDSCATQMVEESFVNYQSFMCCSQKLYMTYPISDDNEELSASPYIKNIQNAFNLSIKKVALTAPNDDDQFWDYIGTPLTTINELLSVFSMAKQQNSKLSSVWQKIYTYLDYVDHERLQKLVGSLNYHNDILPDTPLDNGHKKLDSRLVDQLYGNEIFSSISRLETFFKNPYEYFLKYGLKLTSRKIFEPASTDVGNYFHKAISSLIKKLHKEKLTLSTVKLEQFENILEEVLKSVNNAEEFKVFDQNARNRYLKNRLADSTREISQSIYRQYRDHNNIYALGTEVPFGFNTNSILDGEIFRTNNGKSLKLGGRIDRIDILKANNKFYYSVSDYKSGNIKNKLKNFLVKSLSGISLQLLAYLAILRKNDKKLLNLINKDKLYNCHINDINSMIMGSATYFNFGIPQFDYGNMINIKDMQSILNKLDNQFCYDGIFLGQMCENNENSNYDYIKALGNVSGKSENYLGLSNYALKFNKNKKLDRYSQHKVYNSDKFNLLLDMIFGKVMEATNNIFDGIIDLSPYRLGTHNALEYSEYLPIMAFDSTIGNKFNDLNQLNRLKDADLWSQIENLSSLYKSSIK